MEKNTTLNQRCSQKKAHCKTQNKGYHELDIHVNHEFLDGVTFTLIPYIFILSFLRTRCNTLLFSKDNHSYKVPSKYIKKCL